MKRKQSQRKFSWKMIRSGDNFLEYNPFNSIFINAFETTSSTHSKEQWKFYKVFSVDAFSLLFFFLFKLITTLGSTAYEDIWKLRPKTRKKKKINVEQIYTFFSTFSWVCLSSNKIHNNYITIGKTKTFVTMTGKYSIVDCWLLNNELTHQASFHHQPNVLF